jgi:hypothetical protein
MFQKLSNKFCGNIVNKYWLASQKIALLESKTPAENMFIGSILLLSTLGLTVTKLPCLYVMVHDKQLWKNSCIKIGHLDIGSSPHVADDGAHRRRRPSELFMPRRPSELFMPRILWRIHFDAHDRRAFALLAAGVYISSMNNR